MIQLYTHGLFGGRRPLIFTVDTTKAGSANDTFILPLATGTTNINVNWGDGNLENFNTAGNKTHVYSAPGIYEIGVTGTFVGIVFNNGGDMLKFINITQWGDVVWKSFQNAFYGCANFTTISATDIPNISLTNFSFANVFRSSSFNGSVAWFPSGITSLNEAFGATPFNHPSIASVDMSMVTIGIKMFFNSSFNQYIGDWQLATTLNLSEIFKASAMSTANYTDTIVEWANYVNTNGYPLNVSMTSQDGRTFDTSRGGGVGFANAGAARSYLTKNVTAAAFSDANANGVYTVNFTTNIYTNANGYYFQWNGASWTLFDNLSVSIEVGTGGASTTTPSSSVWVGGTVTNTNGGWTISGDTVI